MAGCEVATEAALSSRFADRGAGRETGRDQGRSVALRPSTRTPPRRAEKVPLARATGSGKIGQEAILQALVGSQFHPGDAEKAAYRTLAPAAR